MSITRRDFPVGLVGVAGLGSTAWAQGAPVEGKDYKLVSPPAPVASTGKVEVVEFFWYGCPHCNHFEPYLAAWLGKLPADIAFRRVPVAFRENPFGIHQRLYYTVESLGLIPTLHAKIFHAIHEQGLKLDKPELIADFVAKQGVDQAKFMSVMDSFAVQTKCKQARSLAESYKIDGVPTLGIAGQYTTAVSLNGTPEKTLAVVDYLVGRTRKR